MINKNSVKEVGIKTTASAVILIPAGSRSGVLFYRIPVEDLQRDFPRCWVYNRLDSVVPSVDLIPKDKATDENLKILAEEVKIWLKEWPRKKALRQTRDALNKASLEKIQECAKVLDVNL